MADSNTNNSTLNAAYNQATGYVQSTIGNLTGSTKDQAHGELKQDSARAENEASHTVGKVGPFAVSGSGGVARDDPDRAQGSWNQTVGSAKEAVGNLIGNEQLKRDGAEQNAEGKGQEAKGQLNDLGSGAGDRLAGAVGGAVAGLTGNKEAQAAYQDQHDRGKTLQRSAEADIEKQA